MSDSKKPHPASKPSALLRLVQASEAANKAKGESSEKPPKPASLRGYRTPRF